MDGVEKACPGPLCKGRSRPVGEFLHKPSRARGVSSWCRDCHNYDVTSRKERQRAEAIAVLGGRCVRCVMMGCMGACCADIRALQIDHVDGKGGLRRKGGEQGTALYRAVKANPAEFQLLCASCNVIKRAEQEEYRAKGSYSRVVPTELRPTDRTAADAQRAATMEERWAAKSAAEVADIVAKRSETRRVARERKLREEAGLPPHPSWATHGLLRCGDCGRHVPPLFSRGLCHACYQRAWSEERRKIEGMP